MRCKYACIYGNISECAHHSCGYWQRVLSEALVRSRNFWSDFTFRRQCGRPCNICRSTALLLLVIYLWLMAHYKTLFDSKSYIKDFRSLMVVNHTGYWKLWTSMRLISSDIWPAKVQCALVSESTDCLMLDSVVECCERKTFSNIDAVKLTQGPLFQPVQVPDFILYQ